MDPISQPDGIIPTSLLAEIEAMAAIEHRSAREILREAVERYLNEYRLRTASAQPKRTPQEAVARLLEMRKGNFLPEGMTIRDLMTYGRA